MPKFLSNVYFKAKGDNRDELIAALKSFNPKDYQGAISHQVVDAGNGRYATSIEQENQDALVSVGPSLIEFLDSVSPFLEEISSELGYGSNFRRNHY